MAIYVKCSTVSMLLLLLTLLYDKKRLPLGISLGVVLIEVVSVNWLIGLNGGASNPFAIILLVPLVVGLIQLPLPAAACVLFISINAQLLQLAVAPPLSHHDMMQHAANMVWSFVGTSVFIAAVILYYRQQLRQRNSAIFQLRETQLRNEQLLAIGTAAAQLTHDAATPIQTINLLLEEWHETHDNKLVEEVDEQVSRLNGLLSDWRAVADDVRQSRTTRYSSTGLIKALKHSLALARPEANIRWHLSDINVDIDADRTLLPALTNIVVNACEETAKRGAQAVNIYLNVADNKWALVISNPVDQSPPAYLDTLGRQFVQSEKGNGVASVLTNATIEKFGGDVKWTLHHSGDTRLLETTITLPAVP